jgi:bacterioferritin
MMDSLLVGLNEALSREYSAAIQYYQHAAVLSGHTAWFARDMLEHAGEEIGHAKLLNDHINYLGGVPTVSVSAVFTASENEAMFRQDLNGEHTAITLYKNLIKEARIMGDYGTEVILLGILEDEEHHANDLETILEVVK